MDIIRNFYQYEDHKWSHFTHFNWCRQCVWSEQSRAGEEPGSWKSPTTFQPRMLTPSGGSGVVCTCITCSYTRNIHTQKKKHCHICDGDSSFVLFWICCWTNAKPKLQKNQCLPSAQLYVALYETENFFLIEIQIWLTCIEQYPVCCLIAKNKDPEAN